MTRSLVIASLTALVTAKSPSQDQVVGVSELRNPARRDLFPINRDFVGRLDADANLIAVDLDDSDNDVVTNDDSLAQLPAQNQHDQLQVDV